MGHSFRAGPNKNNTSGHVGINWSEEKGKWHAKLGHRNKRIHLGYFAAFSDAVKAYETKKKQLKFKGSEE